MPQNVSSLVVYYNKDLFARAGVEIPAAGWTWDEMVERAKRLTVDSDGDGKPEQYGLGVDNSIVRVAPMVWSNGGELVDHEDSPTRATLTTPEAVEALGQFVDLHFVDKVVPDEISFESEDNETRFANGRLAMVMQSRRSTTFFRTISSFDWDVAPLPVLKKPAGVLHSDAYCMPKGSTNKDASWRFLEYALGPEGATTIAKSGRTVPSLISVANSDAFLDPGQKPAHSKVFLDTIPVIRPLPIVSTWPEIEDAMDLEIEIALWRTRMSGAELGARLDEVSRPLFERAKR
jgi:multiple sugar transport system substrate-binding protein